MPKTTYTKNILISTDPTPDPQVLESGRNLNAKVKFNKTYSLARLPKFADGELDGARIYIHGHGDWVEMKMGGLLPEDIATKLAEANVKGAKLISITGCNTARGDRVWEEAQAVATEVYNKAWAANDAGVSSDRHKGITWANYEQRKHHDTRLVDTQLQASQVCIGSFAQRFHKALMDQGAEAPVHARLFPVSIEEKEKDKFHKVTNITFYEDHDEGPMMYDRGKHHAERSKVRITAADEASGGINGQAFEYVDYAKLANEDAAAAANAGAALPTTGTPATSTSSTSSTSSAGAPGAAPS